MTFEHTAYLCHRSEASAIPNLLVATPEVDDDDLERSIYDSGRGDHRAVYKDGIWVGVDAYSADYSDDYSSDYSLDLDPQEQYYKSLLRRFMALRNTLLNADPNELAAMVEANPAKYVNVKPPAKKTEWVYTLEHEYPTPACTAQLDQRSLFQGLEYCTATLGRYETISKQKSCWIWTLLALAGETGTLGHQQIGRIRDLGQRAGQLSVRLRDSAQRNPPSEDEEDMEQWDADVNGTDSEDGENSSSDVTRGLEPEKPSNTAFEGERAVDQGQNPDKEREEATFENATSMQGSAYGLSVYPSGVIADLHPKTDDQGGANDDEHSSPSEPGEIDDDPKIVSDEAASLEQARARLLAQLGDRLIQPTVPAPSGPKDASQQAGLPREGGRHRHNGKVCRDPSCRFDKRRQEAHRRAGLRAAQGRQTQRSGGHALLSREEAERQRQYLRDQKLATNKSEGWGSNGDHPSINLGASPSREMPAAQASSAPDSAKDSVDSINDTYADQRSPSDSTESAEAAEVAAKIGRAEDIAPRDQKADICSEAGNLASPIDLNTRVTIDMILTVVAECYGQKDLLRFREAW